MIFDPDAYLAGTAAPPAPAKAAFDPDAFLARPDSQGGPQSGAPIPAIPSDAKTNYAGLYGGLDKVDHPALQGLDDEGKAGSINQAYIAATHRIDPKFIANNFQNVTDEYAKQEFGVNEKGVTQTQLYGLISARYKKEAEQEDIQNTLHASEHPLIDELRLKASEFWHPTGPNAGGGAQLFWNNMNKPLFEVPAEAPEDAPDIPMLGIGNPALVAGVRNSVVKPIVEGVVSPLGIATLGMGPGLHSAAKIYPAAKAAFLGMTGIFTGLFAKSLITQTPESAKVLMDPKATTQEKTEAVGAVARDGAFTLLGALGMVESLRPKALPKLEGKGPAEAAAILQNEAHETEVPAEKIALTEAAEKLDELGPPKTPEQIAELAPANKDVSEVEQVNADVEKLKNVPLAEGEQASVVNGKVEVKPASLELNPGEPPTGARSPIEKATKLIGIKNAAVDAEFKEMGLEAPEHGERLAAEQAIANAAETARNDPLAGTKLVDDILAKPRPIDGNEVALLLHETTRRAIVADAADARAVAAEQSGDPAAITKAQQESAKAADDYAAAGRAATQAGTVNAQGLALRRMMMKEDYSLASLKQKLAAVSKGGKLTPEQLDFVRDIQKRFNDTLQAADAARKKTPDRLAMTKGRLEKQIRDLDDEIAARQRNPSSKKSVELDAEGKELVEVRDKLKAQHEELFGDEKKPLTTEQQLKKVAASKQRQIEKLEEQLKDRAPFPAGEKPAVGNAATESLQAKIDALKEERDYLRESLQPSAEPPTDIETRSAALDKRIAAIEQQLKDEAPFSKGKRAQPLTPELQAKEDTLNSLKEQRQYMRERLQPKAEPKTRQERALAAFKSRMIRQTEELTQRIKDKNYTPKAQPEPIELDKEAEKLQAAHERVKDEFDEAVARARLEQRTPLEKMLGATVGWRRTFVLSSPKILVKLPLATAARMVFTPLEEAAGSLLGKIPMLRDVAEKAPTEGGFNSRALGKALTEGFTSGMADAKQSLMTGRSDLDVLFGNKKETAVGESSFIDPSWKKYVGQMHSALKAPLKRMAYTLAMEKQMSWAVTQGVDATNPLTQMQFSNRAYRYANRQIFLQDNLFNDAFKSGLGRLENYPPAPTAGKVVAGAARVAIPITKVPTNIVGETLEYQFGLATGSLRFAKAMRAGFDTLTPDQADVIMRNLKKGTLGAAGTAMLIGYFTAKDSSVKFGGQYEPGTKRKPTDIQPNEMEVFGQRVPSMMLDHPMFMTFQNGQTTYHAAASKIRKSDDEPQGIASGSWAAFLGLIDETPFGRETSEAGSILSGSPAERQYKTGEFIKGLLVPSVIDFAAKQMDKDASGETVKRNPKTILEHVETSLPGRRETVKKSTHK